MKKLLLFHPIWCRINIETQKQKRQGAGDGHPPRPYAGDRTSHTAEYLHHIYYKQSFCFLQGYNQILCVASSGVGFSSLRRFCCLNGGARGRGFLPLGTTVFETTVAAKAKETHMFKIRIYVERPTKVVPDSPQVARRKSIVRSALVGLLVWFLLVVFTSFVPVGHFSKSTAAITFGSFKHSRREPPRGPLFIPALF